VPQGTIARQLFDTLALRLTPLTSDRQNEPTGSGESNVGSLLHLVGLGAVAITIVIIFLGLGLLSLARPNEKLDADTSYHSSEVQPGRPIL